ncbi:MAG: AMP-binding protein [Parvularculaceae bacterium]
MTALSKKSLALAMLDHWERAQPDKDFLRTRDGACSYGAFAALVRSYAARFYGAGLRAGDIAPTFIPNSSAAVASWFAAMHIGAVWAPINTEFRGEQLVRALNVTGASTLFVEERYLAQILEALPSLKHVTQVVVFGEEAPPSRGGASFIRFDDLPSEALPERAVVSPSEVAMIQFTSGSTGVSKAVQLSHGYLVGQARLSAYYFNIRPEDVNYCPFPLYHWDATIGTVMGAMVTGATAALADRFSVSRFWDDIRAFDATMFDFMGATLAFLMDRPASPSDKQHRVRLGWGLPMPKFREAFEKRFGVRLLEGYGSTEGGVAVFQRLNETYPQGSCGRPAPEFSLKIVDDDGREVKTGEVGEIITKPNDPVLMMNGYLNMPEVNAELMRDGWYFTGDLGRVDADGNLYFAGRKKDIIRRRGENISALEIEKVIEQHPAVLEVAAFGAPSPYSEEEVAVAIRLRPGAALTEHELLAFCEGRMARYMTPQHVVFLDALPKTPTEKVAKAQLKEAFVAGNLMKAHA